MTLPRSAAAQAVFLLLVACASRAWLFGNPVIHSDEQFYLLVGDRMWSGAWPFVDIFDRKPVGLFLIFAAIRALPGDGILAYQITATVVVAATAFLITRIARRFAGPEAAFGAGVLYLVWLVVFDGAGGQSAVWQNLLTASAALLVIAARSEGLTRRGVAVMLLVGCAMQVKYVALFEGVFFGLWLLWTGFLGGRSAARLAGDAVLWVAAALLPTAAAWAVYAGAGHGEAFVFANFQSFFGQQDDDTPLSNLLKLAEALALLGPLLWLTWRGWSANAFARGWAAAGIGAVLIIHTFEQLYWLPALLPLSVASAAGLERVDRRRAMIWALALGIVAAVALTFLRVSRRGDARSVEALVGLIGQRPSGCLFTFGSEPILYHLTRSCLPTAYIFRSHLGQTRESRGIGIDPVPEVARVLAARPGVIVVREPKTSTNPATARLVQAAVRARYRYAGTVKNGEMRHHAYRLR
jgi:hypothetical protein